VAGDTPASVAMSRIVKRPWLLPFSDVVISATKRIQAHF
jgi:hypothetical protein